MKKLSLEEWKKEQKKLTFKQIVALSKDLCVRADKILIAREIIADPSIKKEEFNEIIEKLEYLNELSVLDYERSKQ